MAKNEVGEFELVLGNKQLLSVFFIVVILLGVFFTMGYIVGRNSTPALEAANRKGETPAKPTIIDSPNAPAPTQVPTATEPKKEEPKETAKAEEPKSEPPKPEPKKEEPKKEEPKAKDKDDKKGKKEKAAAEAPAPAASGPLSGTYLQLAAVPKAESDLLLSVLRKKGFGAAAGPGPEGSNLFRVLVGPLANAEAISKTRSALNDAGMQGSKAIIRKY